MMPHHLAACPRKQHVAAERRMQYHFRHLRFFPTKHSSFYFDFAGSEGHTLVPAKTIVWLLYL